MVKAVSKNRGAYETLQKLDRKGHSERATVRYPCADIFSDEPGYNDKIHPAVIFRLLLGLVSDQADELVVQYSSEFEGVEEFESWLAELSVEKYVNRMMAKIALDEASTIRLLSFPWEAFPVMPISEMWVIGGNQLILETDNHCALTMLYVELDEDQLELLERISSMSDGVRISLFQ
jgi:hypothetical protein